MKRRDFLMTGAAIAAAGLTGPMRSAAGASASPGAVPGAAAAGALPRIRIGDLQVSRLILGSNPFWGYSHKSAQLDRGICDVITRTSASSRSSTKRPIAG